MLDVLFIATAVDAAASQGMDIESVNEFLLSMHALKLNESVDVG
jgi:hypothetical protein